MPLLSQMELLHDLEPVVATELDRHLKVAREWMPHEYVPWSEGRNFGGIMEGDSWDPEQSRLDAVGQTAMVVNLLTEDNLPSYHREIHTAFGADGAWGSWIGQWTAEEGRHAMAIRDYLLVTRAVDPDALERERMIHMTAGFNSSYELDVFHSVAYVSFQELATRISHRNTGKHTSDPLCEQLLARIALDENLHMIFYRNLLIATLDRAPDQTMAAIVDVVRSFEMPGAGIEGYNRRALAIAMAGIYDLRIHHDEILVPVLRACDIWNVKGLSPDGEKAREELADLMADIDARASAFDEKRTAIQARRAARAE